MGNFLKIVMKVIFFWKMPSSRIGLGSFEKSVIPK